jgi:hypothetical protein
LNSDPQTPLADEGAPSAWTPAWGASPLSSSRLSRV